MHVLLRCVLSCSHCPNHTAAYATFKVSTELWGGAAGYLRETAAVSALKVAERFDGQSHSESVGQRLDTEVVHTCIPTQT